MPLPSPPRRATRSETFHTFAGHRGASLTLGIGLPDSDDDADNDLLGDTIEPDIVMPTMRNLTPIKNRKVESENLPRRHKPKGPKDRSDFLHLNSTVN